LIRPPIGFEFRCNVVELYRGLRVETDVLKLETHAVIIASVDVGMTDDLLFTAISDRDEPATRRRVHQQARCLPKIATTGDLNPVVTTFDEVSNTN